jgi:L-ascorbate metabolism protein UlaG (beta-lactamase superfamily)
MEGMNLCFLGALGEDTLNSEAKKATESCDILFVPIGGEGVLDPATAQKIAVQFEPKIIIPSHFSDMGEKDSLNKFIKESGSEKSKPVDKLTIKKKDIENLDSEVVILEAQN